MQLSEVDLSALRLSGLLSTRGVKTASASLNGRPCEFLLANEWFLAPFGASAYQDPTATRLNLELDVTTSSVLPALQAVDQWVVRYVQDNKLFEDMSAEDITRTYHPSLQTSEKYPSIRLRTKMNTAGL